MMNKNICSFLLLFASFHLSAQTELPEIHVLDEAIYLYQVRQYNAALDKLEEIRELKDLDQDSEIRLKYYLGLSGLALFHPEAESQLADLLDNHKIEPLRSFAAYKLGDFKYNDKKYKEADLYFTQVEVSNLKDKWEKQFYFKLAYSQMMISRFEDAMANFEKAATYSSSYTIAAYYYAGYLHYRNGDLDDADRFLKKAEEDAAYANVVPYLRMSIMLKKDQIPKLLEYGRESLNKFEDLKNKREVYLIMGEGYFARKEYKRAQEFFELYQAELENTVDHSTLFKLAFAQYQNRDFQKAANNFKIIALGQDSLADYSSYYMADIYLADKDLRFALRALEKVVGSKVLSSINEPALFNLAKVNFEMERYDEAIKHLNQLIENYPTSAYRSTALDLLTESYLNTKNYRLAAEYIANLDRRSDRIGAVYQKVRFYLGAEEFNNSQFAKAVESFTISIEYPYDKSFTSMANFWLGEAYSIGKFYEDAKPYYEKVLEMTEETDSYHFQSLYGLGYAHFNLKEYEKARDKFRRYIRLYRNHQLSPFNSDGFVRLADCRYIAKDYEQAFIQYQEVVSRELTDQDYALYQSGMIRYLQGELSTAQKIFSLFIEKYTNSTYLDDAVFQKAVALFEAGSFRSAIREFGYLISTFPQSQYVPYALEKRAISYSNLSQPQQALADYKVIINDFVKNQVAESALLGMQEVMARLNQTDDFDQYLAAFKQANPENKGITEIELETAKSLYFNKNYGQAIDRLIRFIEANPETAQTSEAWFYLAESYYYDRQTENALTYYYKVAGQDFFRQNRAINRIAQIELEENNYREAIRYSLKLVNQAVNKKEKENGWENLMLAQFNLSNYDSSILFADKILDQGGLSSGITSKSYLYKGKSFFRKGMYDTAVYFFRKTTEVAIDENAAEAQYRIGEIAYLQKNYEKALEVLFSFNRQFSSYDYWLGKVFLLIAEVYLAQQEDFQARATLKSIIENSPIEEVVELARSRLKKLESDRKKQKNQDSSRVVDTIEIDSND